MGIYKYEKKSVSTYKSSQKYVVKIWKYKIFMYSGNHGLGLLDA